MWKGTPKEAISKLLLIAPLAAALLVGCANPERFKPFEKEMNDPTPTKYETPFNSERQGYRNASGGTTTIPDDTGKVPEVIEPSPFIPGMASTVLDGIPVREKPGFVMSPYAPDKGYIDVRGFPVGTDVRDPYTGKIMKVPLPIESKASRTQTLSAPEMQAPSLDGGDDFLPPSPPVLEP
jgi:hypothetical protein